MYFENRVSNYDKFPRKNMDHSSGQIFDGADAIVRQLSKEMEGKREGNLVLDGYHGTDFELLKSLILDKLPLNAVFFAEEAKLPEEKLYPKVESSVTDDRVFGSISVHTMEDFYDPQAVSTLQKKIEQTPGWKAVYGVGAGLITKGDLNLYADLNRWEIQLRYRKGLDNWGAGNFDDDILRKYKRGYFLEWRMLDRHKLKQFKTLDYLIDANVADRPKMMDKTLLEESLKTFASSPFRLIPYFDEGIWGGHWMEEVCSLPRSSNNYAWCFDGVPEENALGIIKDGVEIEFPAMNLVKTHPKELLGKKVFARFGAEFPIRFDFLDTMDGGNLSLQVHPLTEYIRNHFNMAYTQDESYYILDAKEDACVYLGIKENIDPDTLISALESSRQTGKFDDSLYINKFPAKKHDHFLIPAGTIHCSGANAMVLEISATPYIFTFKLWDWGRVGLDGKPRPINIQRGKENIQFDRTTNWVKNNLVSQIEILDQKPGYQEERTGLHELEFIETRRYWLEKEHLFDCSQSVHMLNLVEGEEAEVFSPDDSFSPMRIHYAETFIVSASVKTYGIRPAGRSENYKIGIIQASVRV